MDGKSQRFITVFTEPHEFVFRNGFKLHLSSFILIIRNSKGGNNNNSVDNYNNNSDNNNDNNNNNNNINNCGTLTAHPPFGRMHFTVNKQQQKSICKYTLHAFCIFARSHARTHARTHAHTLTHTNARTHARTHTHTHTHTP